MMNLPYLSASRIKTFEQCQLKYHALYDLNLVETSHPLALMGSAVHLMFEKATRVRMGACAGSQDPMSYKAEACKEFSVPVEFWTLIDELVKNCVDWGYFRNIARTKGCELELNCQLADGTPVKAIIDRLDIWEDKAEIIDLKTQQKQFEPEELVGNRQARIYNWAARKSFPEATGKTTVSFWVLRHQVQKVYLTAEDAARDENELMEKAKEIRNCAEPKPSPSALCQFCVYKDKCPMTGASIKKMLKNRGVTVFK